MMEERVRARSGFSSSTYAHRGVLQSLTACAVQRRTAHAVICGAFLYSLRMLKTYGICYVHYRFGILAVNIGTQPRMLAERLCVRK